MDDKKDDVEDRLPEDLKQRRMLQTTFIGVLVTGIIVAVLGTVGTLIEANGSKASFLDLPMQGALLVALACIVRFIYLLFNTPFSVTKEAVRDREFWLRRKK
jgi:uncharacterized membrane protein